MKNIIFITTILILGLLTFACGGGRRETGETEQPRTMANTNAPTTAAANTNAVVRQDDMDADDARPAVNSSQAITSNTNTRDADDTRVRNTNRNQVDRDDRNERRDADDRYRGNSRRDADDYGRRGNDRDDDDNY